VNFRGIVETAKLVKDRVRQLRAGSLVNGFVLQTFLSLFPMLLVGIAVLGFIASRRTGDDDLAKRVIENLKLEGDLQKLVTENLEAAKNGRGGASIIGGVTLLLSALKVVASITAACNVAWQVPDRGWKDKVAGILWLVGAIVLIGGSAGAVGLVKIIPVPFVDIVAGFFAGVLTGGLLFWWTQLIFTNVRVGWKAFVPGALVGGIGVSMFQLFGALVMARLLANASALYASLAAVIALLGVLSLFGWLLVMSVIINVVLWERKHGTVQLAIYAPSLPKGSWLVADRGGQRPPIKKPLPAVLKRLKRG
jgi:membrane protein